MNEPINQTDLINTATRHTVLAEFRKRFGTNPDYVIRAPGRVNLLGEHVDYNNGIVLPIAIDRATWLAFRPNNTDINNLLAIDLEQNCSFTPATLQNKQDCLGSTLPDWALYPGGVCWAAGTTDLDCPGLDAVYSSNIPSGSGLSSSASIEMAFALAWQTLSNWGLSPMQRALLGKKAENLYVGVQSGIMDQFASACGKENSLLALDCRSLQWRTILLPAGFSYIVANTMKPRRLSSGEYNKRKADCDEAIQLLAQFQPGLSSLREISLEDFNHFAPNLPERIERRARHVVEEIDRTVLAISLLENGEIEAFGKLLNLGHRSLRDLYEVSIPELDKMVEIAQSLPGCLGARLTGAGFGGCTINIVEEEKVDDFVRLLASGYQSATGISPDITVCRSAEGASLELF